MSERRPVHQKMRLLRTLVSAELIDDAKHVAEVQEEDVNETYRRLLTSAIAAEMQSDDFQAKEEALEQKRQAATAEPTEDEVLAARMLIKSVSEDEQ